MRASHVLYGDQISVGQQQYRHLPLDDIAHELLKSLINGLV
ncbi:hypothetical protein [Caballeronia sp. NCTM1]|nr:hypothetical protein [Caballeronia sp. NCTM1]